MIILRCSHTGPKSTHRPLEISCSFVKISYLQSGMGTIHKRRQNIKAYLRLHSAECCLSPIVVFPKGIYQSYLRHVQPRQILPTYNIQTFPYPIIVLFGCASQEHLRGATAHLSNCHPSMTECYLRCVWPRQCGASGCFDAAKIQIEKYIEEREMQTKGLLLQQKILVTFSV
jgi:hypothetical protein